VGIDGKLKRVEADMLRQAVNTVTLTALVNLTFAGCTKNVALNLSETSRPSDERIIGITSKDHTEFVFDSIGGRYDPSRKTISGITVERTHLVKRIDELRDVTVINQIALNIPPIVIKANEYAERLRSDKPCRIQALATKQGKAVWFDKNGGRIDVTRSVVVGFSREGSHLEIPFEDVDYVRITKSNILGTALLTVAIFGAVAAIGLSSFDFFPDSNTDYRF
jgi:hypothetical protein